MNTLNYISNIYLEVNGVKVDITPSVVYIEITEDIFAPYPNGYMEIEELASNSVISKFGDDGLIGQGEELKVIFLAKLSSFAQEVQGFYIYKVSPFSPDREDTSRQKMSYTLYFSTRAFFINEMIRINKYYEDTLSNIVKEIAESNLQINLTTLDATHRKQTLYFPKLTPIECINMCASRSISEENSKESNYVFYGDINQKYHFVSLGKLYSKKPLIGTYDQDGIMIEVPFGTNYLGTGTIAIGSTKYYSGRYTIKPISPLNDMVKGMYSSALLEFDVTRRKYMQHNHTLDKEFEKTRHLVEYPIFSNEKNSKNLLGFSYKNPSAFLSYYTSAQWIHDEDEVYDKSSHSTNNGREYILQRKSQLQQLGQMGLEIELPGTSEISLADVVFFGRQSLDVSANPTGKRNPFVAGKYLITRKTTMLENSAENNTSGFNLKTVFSLRKDSDTGTNITLPPVNDGVS